MTGIDFARDGSALPFLFIESKTHPVPSGNFRTAPFLSTALGFTAGTDFVHMEASELSALADFRATLSNYSAIWVASDHGGMLTASELTFLNDHSADIIDYLNAGGGLFAEAESNQKGLIGATPRFGFLPFLVASTDFGAAEISNTVTSFGASLGLTNSDVNGNFSHNYFSATGGMNPVDLFNGDSSKILSLAFRGQVGTTGVTPSLPLPSPILLFSIGLIGMIGARVITRPESR
ncbi:MAG: hypothetical protein D6690_10625 [Nitrospirae bacterium]|nr:MAG: hypothetical protein D6690_10625 [Nitrospirota bacterium]